MDYATCNVVYVDRTAREDKLVKRDDAISTASLIDTPNHAQNHAPGPLVPDAVDSNLQTLLGTFTEGSCRNHQHSLVELLANKSQCTSVPLANRVYRNCLN
jgi:3',5'-cyclic-nucleotide phosphodiesterase